MTKQNDALRLLILTALLAALTSVATLVISIPSPTGGFFNLGDSIILLTAFSLPPIYAMAAAGIGSALADLWLGYALYAPATLGIKATMALAAALIFAKAEKSGRRITGAAVGSLAAEGIMVGGYFLYETVLYGAKAAFGNVLLTNLPQGAVGLVGGVALFAALDRLGIRNKIYGGT